MHAPRFTVVDRGPLAQLDAAFHWLSRKTGFLSALALASSGASLLLIAFLSCILLAGLAALSIPPPLIELVARGVFLAFLIPIVMGLLTWAHLASPVAVAIPWPGLNLKLIQSHLRDGQLRAPRSSDEVVRLLNTLARLPVFTTGLTVFYALLGGIAACAWQWPFHETAVLPALSFLILLTAHVFGVQILTGLLSGPVRHRIKQYLFSRRISFRENITPLIARRFILLVLLVSVSLAELAMLTMHSLALNAPRMPLAFGISLTVTIALLAFLSFQSVRYSLREIQVALAEIAYGLRRSATDGPGPENRDLIEAAYEIAEIRSNLEKKIHERTRELNETMTVLQSTLDDVRSIQLHQDGDFFLTSLLLEPLSKNRASCVNLSVEFLVEQKKRFEFKHWKKEIGGDICIAHSIFLKNRIYTVVMNADAMGKSMQGAGGAIVLGASIKSIIDRTRFSSMEQDRHPEDWLHRAYVELARVFESFEGSMLVSMALALIDDESGLMYYINVEHPWTVLYRRGLATFIERELRLRKLGVSVPGAPFAVQLFRFRPGDVILMGSDGRDDLMISSKSGEPAMNEDEELFLRLVEEGCGSLAGLRQALGRCGTITDDLSLIRIAFQEDRAPASPSAPTDEGEAEIDSQISRARELKHHSPDRALEELRSVLKLQKDHRVALRGIIRLLVRAHNFAEALPYLDRYTDLRPDDTEMLFIASYCLTRTGDHEKAAELCERIVLRRPDEVRYLLHLARIQALRHDYFEADRLLDQILQIAPENEQALSLKNSL